MGWIPEGKTSTNCGQRAGVKKGQRDTKLLALKMEKGVHEPKMWAATRSWKRKTKQNKTKQILPWSFQNECGPAGILIL